MKKLWLLYADEDYAVNQDFGQLMRQRGQNHGLEIQPVCLSQLELGMTASGQPFCRLNGENAKPNGVISRQRNALISRHLEQMGVPVFNNSRVCALCNDKRRTCQFLQGLPMPETFFPLAGSTPPQTFPVVVKPACSHGGDRVALAQNADQWQAAMDAISPHPALWQQVVSQAGMDLRIYVVDGRIVTGVMRRARQGIVSNYKLGGMVHLHEPNAPERALAERVIDRFDRAGAHLWFAGIDLLYHCGQPVIGEVEDVVGSRMLYQCSRLDIADMYLDAVSKTME